MSWLLEKLGIFIDFIAGDRKTKEFTGAVANRQVTLRSDNNNEYAIIATIVEVTFVTHYRRWKFYRRIDTVYRVHLQAPEHLKAKLDPRIFEPVTLPLLCTSFLRETKFPHTHALHAFLDHVNPIVPNIKCEL